MLDISSPGRYKADIMKRLHILLFILGCLAAIVVADRIGANPEALGKAIAAALLASIVELVRRAFKATETTQAPVQPQIQEQPAPGARPPKTVRLVKNTD